MMRFEDIESLLGAYALDAVDPDEREVVEHYLATHPRARAEVAQHQEVATLLAFSGAAAPEGLWDRIAASLDEEMPEPGPELAKVLPMATSPVMSRAAPPHPPGRIRPWRRAGLLVAAVAAVAAAVIVPLGMRVVEQNRELAAAEGDESALEALYQDARNAPGSLQTELVSPDGALAVETVVTPDGAGYLDADDLPALTDEQTYQLWAVFADRVVSLGVLGPDPSLAVFQTDASDVGEATLAITAERSGGVAVAEQPPLVTGTLA